MGLRTMELLFEYMSFILCIHKIAKKKVNFNIWMMIPFLIEWIWIMCSNSSIMPTECRVIVFGGIFLYAKKEVTVSWKKTVNACGLMLIIIMSLQVFQYYLLSLLPKELFIIKYGEILVNLAICVAPLSA